MNDEFHKDFGSFNGHIWLNCAHQGPLPQCAEQEAIEAIKWKTLPYELTTERFNDVPIRLKGVLAQLTRVHHDEIILGNSASYGLHLLANGVRWEKGDEILLVKGDFPSNILPWLALEKRGVKIRYIEPINHLPSADELSAKITPAVRLFCTSWVHSFSGVTADLNALGKLCRTHGITFVVNGSQALGTRPIAIPQTGMDAFVSVGFKWLCGPYGTGFCWIKPELLQTLEYNQAYWLAEMTADDLAKNQNEIRNPNKDVTAKTYDVFGTANFFNFKPWAASVEYLVKKGVHRIADHNQKLVSKLIRGLDPEKYMILSPEEVPIRSTLIFLSHVSPKRNNDIYERLKRNRIHISFRHGNLRFAPHMYNTDTDIEAALAVLDSV